MREITVGFIFGVILYHIFLLRRGGKVFNRYATEDKDLFFGVIQISKVGIVLAYTSSPLPPISRVLLRVRLTLSPPGRLPGRVAEAQPSRGGFRPLCFPGTDWREQ